MLLKRWRPLSIVAAAVLLSTAVERNGAATPLAQLTGNQDTISGAGATFPYPVYTKWGEAYKRETGVELLYQGIGSGGGIKQIMARAVTFAATDIPLSAQDLADAGLLQWPMVLGGIVPVVNIPGVKAGDLVLDGPTLAKIFLGEIKSWSDPALKKLNPALELPSAGIAVIHRADGSATSYNLTNFLSKVSGEWKTKVGFGPVVDWPTGIGVKGSGDGVSNVIEQTPASIGCVEAAFAKLNRLTTAKMINRNGKIVEPAAQAIQAAAAARDWEHGEERPIITDQPGDPAWPISTATFILMPKTAPDASAARNALKFFAWAYAKGDGMAAELSYVPLPAKIKKLVQARWAEMKGPDGKVLLDHAN